MFSQFYGLKMKSVWWFYLFLLFSDSVRAFKERNKIGRFNEEAQKKKLEEQQKKEEEEKEKAASMKVGDRYVAEGMLWLSALVLL